MLLNGILDGGLVLGLACRWLRQFGALLRSRVDGLVLRFKLVGSLGA